jgi:hypothetical protein
MTDKNTLVNREEFEALVNKALIFNINYVIRPKYSILRFLFGEVETKPVDYIRHKLKYFPFYGYYINQIEDFININSLEFISNSHVNRIIDEVNKRILEEISSQSGTDANRLNLVKLLYYFFIDLSDNNPINIKLPKKILSVFFDDKGFHDIKNRIDGFFSEEIFIQEAMELMTLKKKKPPKAKTETDVSEEKIKDILSNAKGMLISRESSKKEIEKILKTHEKLVEITEKGEQRQKEIKVPETAGEKTENNEGIYSGDLEFAAQLSGQSPDVTKTEEEKRESLINDLFCEETYRRKIIKKLFSKEENSFKTFIGSVIQQKSWSDAVTVVEEFFNRKKINYYSEEAVKFVDILHSYFTSEGELKENTGAV